MSNTISRRKFMEMSGAAAAGLTLGMTAFSDPKPAAASDTINLGIIGTGDRGTWEAYILKELPELRVMACCDILPEHLENGLREAAPGAVGYRDYRQLLDNPEVDAVIIATPLHLHYQMARDALDAGKHVFCEKTMTYSIDQALELVRAVQSSDRVFQVGYQTRNNPLLQRVREMIHNGACGELTHIRCSYHRNGDWRRPVANHRLERLINWRMYREFSGGLMAELCSHHIDIANWILDHHPVKVCGFGGIDYWKDGRETFDNVNTVFEYPGGVKAIFTSITTNAHYGISLQYMGSKGTIEINGEEGQAAMYYAERELLEEESAANSSDSLYAVTGATRKAWQQGRGVPITVENQPRSDKETTGLAFRHFATCIRERRTPVSNVESGRDAAVAVHLANRAMREGTIASWLPEYSR